MPSEQSEAETYQSCDDHGIVYDTEVTDECPMCKELRQLRARRVGGR